MRYQEVNREVAEEIRKVLVADGIADNTATQAADCIGPILDEYALGMFSAFVNWMSESWYEMDSEGKLGEHAAEYLEDLTTKFIKTFIEGDVFLGADES